MSNLNDIFDLPEGQTTEPKKEKKERKKAEMSDEKKTAMLERLKAGREKRQENLKAKKEPKEKPKEEPKEVIISEKITKGSIDNKQNLEAERLSFINMMAGKSKPNQTEKFERPKKKVQSTPEEKPKIETKKDEVKEVPSPIIAPILPTNVALVREPVVIRTFKKPIWA